MDFLVIPRHSGLHIYSHRLSDCLWMLDHNNPEKNKNKPNWQKGPYYFLHNNNYRDKPNFYNQVIFSIGYLGEFYVKQFFIDALNQPYWCGEVEFNCFTEELDIVNVKPWTYDNAIEGSKKTGWLYADDLRDLFRVEVDLHRFD